MGPLSSAPHAVPQGWGLCPTTASHLCSPGLLSQPTSLPLLSQIQSAAPPSTGPFSLVRLFMSSMSQCSHLTTNPTVAHILGHGTWQRLPHLPLGWSGTFSSAGSQSAQVWIPHTQLRGMSEDVDSCQGMCPAQPSGLLSMGGPCCGIRGRPMDPVKPQSLQRQAPTSPKPTETSLPLS